MAARLPASCSAFLTTANRSESQELRLRNLDISPYVQDDIKLTPELTLNLGVRWDIQVPFTENNNLIVFFDPDNTGNRSCGRRHSGIGAKFGNCTGCAGYNRADIHCTHFGPRLGFAYKLDNKTVVQGGFDIAFLDGGAYEYGTNKVAVNYGNLLTGAFSRPSTGSTVVRLRELGYQLAAGAGAHALRPWTRRRLADRCLQQERMATRLIASSGT